MYCNGRVCLSLCVCLTACLSVCLLAYLGNHMAFTKFLDMFTVAMTRSFDGTAIHHVFPFFLDDVTFSHIHTYNSTAVPPRLLKVTIEH